MQCPACGEASHERARFCTGCGTPLPVHCPACNEVNPPAARFCARCGARIDASETLPEAERRQVSVMFCDLVDSTPLSERLDPEELAEVMRAYELRVASAIARFDGYVARYVGDGVLSYFGWPESKEANSERAVRAALAAISALEEPIRGERLQVHIGIATGLIVVGEPIGFGESRQLTAVGETLNLASRLEGIAEPDSIVIDDVTRRQIGGLFNSRDLGELTIRGFRAPVRAWRVLGERAVGDRFAALRTGRLVPLVDREEELALLMDRWRLAKVGQGQLVLLAGEPGIGKSRLVAEVRARLRIEPHAILRYFCSPHHQASPLYPLIARLEYEARFDRRDGPSDRLRNLEIALAAAGPSAEETALIADLLGMPLNESHQKLDLSPQAKKQRTFAALTRLGVALARQRPLLLIAEDVHWADPSSLELLDWMIALLPDAPILLVVSFRPEFVPPWVGHANATQVTLGRFNRRDAERLAAEVMLTHVLPSALLDRIVTQSDGIPLFIEELTKSALENAETYAGLPLLLPVPETLQALLTARLDRLPAAKRVAQVGATIGREFSQSLLAAVAQIPEEQLADGLDKLVGSGLASRRREMTDAIYTFKHALVQEAIYDSLLRRRRAEIHARIVAAAESDALLGVTEPGLLGYHCAQAGLLAKAASYYRIAGGRSAERAAAAETRTYLERGLQFAGNLPDGPDRHRLEAELLIALGRILMVARGSNDPEARAAIERAVAVCRKLGSPEMLARSLYSLGIMAEARAELSEGQAVGEELRDLAVRSGDSGIAVAAHVRLGHVAYYRGQFPAARAYFAEALALCARGTRELRDIAIAPDPPVAAAFLSVALAHLGYIEQAISYGKSAVEGAEKLGLSSPAFPLILSVWARTLDLLGDIEQCAACSRMLVAVCEEQGFSYLLAGGQCQLGWVVTKQGDIGKGKALLLEGIAASRTVGSRLRPEVGKYLLSDILALSGQRDEALAMLDEVLEFSRATGACWLDAELLRKKGELLLASAGGNDAQAEQEFRHAIDIARSQSAKLFELRAATSLARLWSDQGRRATARELLRPIYGWFSQGADTPDVREARSLLVELDEAPSPA
ncbi:MAG TPA: AAA family ATPase [Acetobacteraceae bacterium]|nr:AAA family ATPase [Acetobacteraceae bacterium]